MPVLVVADLHLDMFLRSGRDPFAGLDPDVLAALDALIIAGDLSNKARTRWTQMIRHIARHVAPDRIHLLPGNHDFYDHRLDGEARLAGICADEGVQFVQKTELILGGSRFLLCTLWTDFCLHGAPASAMRIAQTDMSDYRYIRIGPGHRRARPSDTAFLHADHRAWLQECLAAPFPGRTVVVSHHCPHPDLVSAQRQETDPAYASDLVPLIERHQPDAWLYGHTHFQAEATVGRTRVLNVSLG